jgi:hypothetical protein
MAIKATYEELEKRVKELEREAEKHKRANVASEVIIVANMSETLRLKIVKPSHGKRGWIWSETLPAKTHNSFMWHDIPPASPESRRAGRWRAGPTVSAFIHGQSRGFLQSG